jgi:hypothetical protein
MAQGLLLFMNKNEQPSTPGGHFTSQGWKGRCFFTVSKPFLQWLQILRATGGSHALFKQSSPMED